MEQFLTELQRIKKEFQGIRYIPSRYEREILIALSHYPELKHTQIEFALALHAVVPYGTKPTFMSCFLPREKRIYTITILEYAEEPIAAVLIKNINPRMRIAVFGHELAHVVQYDRCNPFSLLKTLVSYLHPSFKKRMERDADKRTIDHGLGEELLEHAEYIRSVPGYIKKRPEINRDYLHPSEIKHLTRYPERISTVS